MILVTSLPNSTTRGIRVPLLDGTMKVMPTWWQLMAVSVGGQMEQAYMRLHISAICWE